MKKLLTIIVPTYNAEKYLKKGLESFLLSDPKRQDCLEVLVVNDGSTDQSLCIASDYVNRYPGVFRILNKENGGHGSAVNAGAKEAAGKYFKVVDADDWVDTKVLERLIGHLKNIDCDAIVMGYQCYDILQKQYIPKSVEVNPRDCWDGFYYGPYDLEQILSKWEELYWGLTFHGIIYHTGFYRKLNYHLVEKVFYEDQEYAAVPMAFAKAVVVIPELFYVYRVGDVNQSISFQSSMKRLDHYETVLYRMAGRERYLGQFAKGGEEYWKRKTAKFLNDYYQLCLIRNPDKKQCRKRIQKFNGNLLQKGPVIYRCTRNAYRAFRILNGIGIGEKGYQKVVLPVIWKVRAEKKNRQGKKA